MVELDLESLSKMTNEYQKLEYAKRKVLQNDQYSIHILLDNAGSKKYVLMYDKNNNLLKVEEYQDNYTLQIDRNEITLQTDDNETKFTLQEILHPSTPQFTQNKLNQLIQNLQNLNLAQIYFGVKKQSFTDTEANENLMNYVHFSRDAKSTTSNLININQRLFKEDDLWLDLNEDIEPVNNLIKQYQVIAQNSQIIKRILDKLNDASLSKLENLFTEDENATFSKKDLLHDTGWKLAGAAAELLVADKLQKISGSINFHNVILPFDYGDGEKQNQIDNLLVNEKGIFCIEVKSKKVPDEFYNFDREEQQYAYVRQVINHVHAVKSYLLQRGLFIESKYIHPVILVVNRSSDKRKQHFRIRNSLPLQVIDLDGLENLRVNMNGILVPDKINQISNLLQASDEQEPTYAHYNFLPKLAPSVQAIEQFNNELSQLSKMILELADSLGQYYKAKNYQKLVKIISVSPAFQYFNSHK